MFYVNSLFVNPVLCILERVHISYLSTIKYKLLFCFVVFSPYKLVFLKVIIITCYDTVMEALKFISPAICIVAGSTSSGKSTLVFEILKNNQVMFTKQPVHIIYAYGVWQTKFAEMQNTILNIEFFNGLPTKENLESWSMDGKHRILVLDDLMSIAEKDNHTLDLFTKHSHHMNFSVFFIVQNLFSGGKYFRCISLQTHYFILFKNRRDEHQIHTFARQLFPSNTHYFMDAYKKATQEKYSYILIDISPHSNPEYSLRSHILPGEVVSVFIPKK